MMTEKADVAIVGAGIIGLAHAYLAARAGLKVAVFERNPSARGASVRNFGMIWPIGQPAGEIHQLALRSRELWLQLLSEARLPYLATGSLHAAYREDEAEVGREFADLGRALGYDCTWLLPGETLKKTRSIREKGLLGALWSPTEMSVDPRQIVSILPEFLQQCYGVAFHFSSPVAGVEPNRLYGNRFQCSAAAVVIAGGDDFETLFPGLLQSAGLTRCKLQMLRTVAQPAGWALGPSLAFGLTFRHYPTFQHCESLTRLKARVAEETPELDMFGIHVMASETATRQITLGDSHEYGLDVDIFDREEINNLILSYAQEHLTIPDFRIEQTWHGVYAKHPAKPFLRLTPQPGVEMLIVTSGIGMTLSFGLAEQTMHKLQIVPTCC